MNSLIPSIDYDKSFWFGEWYDTNRISHSAHISRLLLPVATMGSILNIPAPFPNSSYAVNLYGPSISCDTPKNRTFTDKVSEVIARYSKLDGNITYVGFVPTCRPETTTTEGCAIRGLDKALDDSLVDTAPTLDSTAEDIYYSGSSQVSPATFYVVTPDGQGEQAKNTVKCELYNSSYSINFTFDNGLQDIKYDIEKLNGVSILDAGMCREGKQFHHCNPGTAYLSLMNAMGDLLLGATWRSPWVTNINAAQRTRIGSTTLVESPDMHHLYREKPKSPIKYMSMGDTLEELFANVTISIFSDVQFLQNDTVASYGPITRFSAQNAFSYEPRNLFIAYGIGILFSMIIVIYGLLCIRSASASYANSFSTIVRTTRNPGLDAVVPNAETSGAEPLSKNIGKIRLKLRRQGKGLEGGSDEATFFAVELKSDDGNGTREAAPTESLLKQNMRNQHSDTDEISNTQGSADVNLQQRKDNRED
jgi:hypothetical protein